MAVRGGRGGRVSAAYRNPVLSDHWRPFQRGDPLDYVKIGRAKDLTQDEPRLLVSEA